MLKGKLEKKQFFQFVEKSLFFLEKWIGLKMRYARIFCGVEALKEALKLAAWLHVFLQGSQVYRTAAGVS